MYSRRRDARCLLLLLFIRLWWTFWRTNDYNDTHHYWPSLFPRTFVIHCARCQRSSNFFKLQVMPLHEILKVEIFDAWGIDLMRPFMQKLGCWPDGFHHSSLVNWDECFMFGCMDNMCGMYAWYLVCVSRHVSPQC